MPHVRICAGEGRKALPYRDPELSRLSRDLLGTAWESFGNPADASNTLTYISRSPPCLVLFVRSLR